MQRAHKILLIASIALTAVSIGGYFRYTTTVFTAVSVNDNGRHTFGNSASGFTWLSSSLFDNSAINPAQTDGDDDNGNADDDVTLNVTEEWKRNPELEMALVDDQKCINKFLAEHEARCSRYSPNAANIPHKLLKSKGGGTLARVICPCIPKNLLGSLSLIADRKRPSGYVERSLKSMSSRSSGLDISGGRWFPPDCVARQRVAILVPYRNREEHLRQLVYSLHPTLQRQKLDYTIFVIEQLKPVLFNRASLLNVGYMEAKAVGNFDCLILHDVDMYPRDDRNFYMCSHSPRHMGRYRETRVYSFPKYFGGIVAIKPGQFAKINGLSNKYYGWGGEDDEFYRRIQASHKKFSFSPHYPKCVAAYATPFHTRDKGNEMGKKRHKGRQLRPKRFKQDGLSSLRYTVVERIKLPLYTKIMVQLPPPP